MYTDLVTSEDKSNWELVTPEKYGTKAVNLLELRKIGVNVPPFVLLPYTFDVYNLGSDDPLDKFFWSKVRNLFMEYDLLSVRSSTESSMPGLLHTEINIGMDHHRYQVAEINFGLAIADRVYASCLESYINREYSNKKLEHIKYCLDVIQSPYNFDKYIQNYVDTLLLEFGEPPDRKTQIMSAIRRVKDSFNDTHFYRDKFKLPDRGTGFILQRMVHGNLNNSSGSGVYFSHDPVTGEHRDTGDFLFKGLGLEVVSGSKDPISLEEIPSKYPQLKKPIRELLKTSVVVRNHFEWEAADIEFTIQDGTVWILQAREAKLSSRAKLRMGLDNVRNGHLTVDEFINKFGKEGLISVSSGDPALDSELLAEGRVANGGSVYNLLATGHSDVAISGPDQYIWISSSLNRGYTECLLNASGVIIIGGGPLSHEAILAREAGIPAIILSNEESTADFLEKHEWINTGSRMAGPLTIITKEDKGYLYGPEPEMETY